MLGNYADETTLLGTAGQIALGLTGLDVAADVRDMLYNITHWEWSREHILQTVLDGVGLIPVIGTLKNIDEVADLVKHGDEIIDGIGDAAKRVDDVGDIKPSSLSNVEARQWYLNQESKIKGMLDSTKSFEEQAKQAFDLRNQFRTQARELMLDRELAESLYKADPNMTWEQIINKYKSRGLSGNALWQEIINASTRSRTSVNKDLGLE